MTVTLKTMTMCPMSRGNFLKSGRRVAAIILVSATTLTIVLASAGALVATLVLGLATLTSPLMMLVVLGHPHSTALRGATSKC